MANFLVAGLALGLVAMPPLAGEFEHRVRIDHASGPVDVQYRSTVTVKTRQIGTVAPPGKASTQACLWRANVVIEREARHLSGSVMRRTIERSTVIEGNRPGACAPHRASIDREVARRGEALQAHLVAFAQEDRPVLAGELETLRGNTGG